MENRRLFSFLLTSMVFLWLWTAVIAPRFFPDPPKKDNVAALLNEDVLKNSAPPADQNAEANERALEFAAHPTKTIRLGSSDETSGYAMEMELTSRGAAVNWATLTAPQYKDLQDRKIPARIIGNNDTDDRTFTTAVDYVDALLAARNETLETVNWEVVEQEETDTSSVVVFEYISPDQALKVRKTYTLARVQADPRQMIVEWHTNPALYTVDVMLEAVNLTDTVKSVSYEVQGPVGVLFENEEHTSKFRDIHIEFLDGTKAATLAASKVDGYCADVDKRLGRIATSAEYREVLREDHEWTSAFRYVGVDVQFFAALIAPLDDRSDEERTAQCWFERTYPVMVSRHLRDAKKSDVSVRMASHPIELKGQGDSFQHRYAFFVGPKHRDLLDPPPLEASQVLNYGMFGFVARGMHFLLDLFFSLGMPYFLAIICLTVLVRGCLFPLSRKQAIMAARQKELQPQITALKEKFGDDKEKLARAQMELWRKNGINPLSGCLPLFLQLPIFIGLYTALNSAVDLRLQRFLWIQNLAAPDALFRLPFALPFGLGQDFSILPLCTVALFLAQQKMFMPPAQDEQQELQYKMMNIMTGVMGFMFWHQPAGLCLYFIASSLWSIAERKLLGTGKLTPATPAVQVVDPGFEVTVKPARTASQSTAGSSAPSRPAGFWQRLLDAAADAQKNAEQQKERNSRGQKSAEKKKRQPRT